MSRTSTFKSPFADIQENKTSAEDKLLQDLGIDPTIRLRAQLHKRKIQFKPDFSDSLEVTFYSYYDEVELEEGWYNVELGEKVDSGKKMNHRRVFQQRVLNPVKTKF